MNFFARAANGWNIAKSSYRLLTTNKILLIFPLLSGLSILLIFALILAPVPTFNSSILNWVFTQSRMVGAFYVFLYYLFNYFVILFFNVGLVHCVSSHFDGNEVSVKSGMAHSFTRLGSIFSWTVFAATIGTFLHLIEEYFGSVGKLVTSIIGIIFNVASFFVLPILAYENIKPLKAFRRSAQLMKEKWGEASGANFNFLFVQFISCIFISIIAVTIGTFISVNGGIAVAVIGILFLVTVTSAVRTIFITSIYKNITGKFQEQYEQKFIDNLFIIK